jgi:hypothetical protein
MCADSWCLGPIFIGAHCPTCKETLIISVGLMCYLRSYGYKTAQDFMLKLWFKASFVNHPEPHLLDP